MATFDQEPESGAFSAAESVTPSGPVISAGSGVVRPGLAFAPEAHLPRERRLLIDGSGVVLETALGIRHSFPWAECDAVLRWSERIEIVLNSEVSIVVRQTDWHHGAQALRAIAERAPRALLISMPDEPESEPSGYELRGLATSSSIVLGVLILGLAGVAGLGFSIGWSDHRWQAFALGGLFAAPIVGVVRAIRRRLRVPSRWRAAAVVRGRTSVRLDSGIARSSRPVLWVALVGLILAAVVVSVIAMFAGRPPNGPVIALVIIVAGGITRELRRRRLR